MKQKDYNHLVNIGFLGNSHGEIRNYTNNELKPYKYEDVSNFVSKQMDEKIDYHNVIITFPVGTDYGTNGFYGARVLIDHAVHQVEIKQILHSKGVIFKNGESLLDEKYSQYPIALLIVVDGIAMVSDVYANPYSNNLAYSRSNKFKAIQINEEDIKELEKNKTLSKLSWMFSGFFIANHRKRFRYEECVIDPILNTIKNNQEYLCKKENIPQLAKLGYMYNTLWYSGRICWGSNGIISEDGDCEDNPKYKIEMVEPKNERIENLVYDAWGMHVSNNQIEPTFEEFYKLVKNGKELSEFEIKLRKPNKTMPEWVEVLTSPEYKYQYNSKRGVYNHLLCVIGNGYGIDKNGYVFSEAGGADQDIDLYGQWENCKFRKDIQHVVDEILSYKEVKLTCDKANEFCINENDKYNQKHGVGAVDALLKELEEKNPEIFDKITKDILQEETERKTKYHSYYPISVYSIIHIIDNPEKNITPEPSVLQACIEICEEIIAHQKEESEDNINFAKIFLAKRGRTEFLSSMPKEIDKYELEKKIYKIFNSMLSKHFKMSKKSGEQTPDVFHFALNDTKKSDYADNNYYGNIIFSKEIAEKLSFGFFNKIESWMTPFANDMQLAIDEVKTLEDIKAVQFYYDNDREHITRISIKIYVHDKYQYVLDELKSEEKFISDGFQVGDFMISYSMPEDNLLFITTKPKPLGSKHPDNKNGIDYFSLNKQLIVLDNKTKKKIAEFQIDERGVNVLRSNNKTAIAKWMLEEYSNMKASDSEYGTYVDHNNGKSGKRNLYAHDFIRWLSEHKMQVTEKTQS